MKEKFYVFVFCFMFLSPCFAAKKTFVFCAEGSPSSFNPQLATDGSTYNATHAIYNTLTRFKYGTTDLIPGLAKSWKVSKDGKTITVNLRKGVKFHKTKWFTPTRNFNADDVLFSFNRARLKSHPYHLVNGGTYEYFNSMSMGELIKDIVKVNDYRVKFILSRPESPFMANLAMDFAGILSKEYADKLMKEKKPEQMDNLPIGTGPFIFKSYKKDSAIRYDANKEFYGGAPKIDRLIFAITPDASVRYQKLRTGECHLIAYPAPEDLKAIQANKDLKLLKKPSLSVGYLAMNVEKKPFDNKWVRRAVSHALNKKSYMKAIYLGNSDVAKNPLPPLIWSYNNSIKDHVYSPKKAKAMLKKAGMPDGFETQLWVLPVSRPYIPNGKKLGEMMQADLAKVGIKAKLVSFDWPTYLSKTARGEHHMMQFGWTSDNADPDNFLYTLLSCDASKAGANRARWCHKPFDKLVIKAKTITSKAKRAQLYKKAQVIFKEESPWVTISNATVFRAMKKNVFGYKIDPLGRDMFHTVGLK